MTEPNINSIVENCSSQITTLTEYRTRLISDVVTGKIDVRNIPITEEFVEKKSIYAHPWHDTEDEMTYLVDELEKTPA